MKIAVPTTHNDQVDSHFGHCEFFTVFTVENNSIINSEVVQSPQGCGCKSNIAEVLAQMGVSTMLAGNMGQGAVYVLNASGIDVYRGCEGDVKALVEDFIKGEVSDSGLSCSQHERHAAGEECGHNH
ncbi:MAG TPA: NifB/NifX family molybdenum-iron cluster-binding protein [Ignavibacteriales bacterium]|nr:NifB/NifX family molybdenum-iron cluster-binding protein [Ignavibacteriales bacterium]